MNDSRPDRAGPVLVYGFGTAVAMWTAGYLCRLPLVEAPPELLAVLLVLCLPGGGFLAGRATGSARTAVLAGLVASLVNLLVLGALLSSPDQPNRIEGSRLLWIPLNLVAGAALAGLGGWLGRRFARDGAEPRSWRGAFALVSAGATFLLVVAGGLVTGEEAGMAVYDWPTTESYNMFFYPATRMTGGIYYEHTHRLFGTLVGLCAIVLGVMVFRRDRRRSVKLFTAALLLAVIVQGLLGGFRVTEDNRWLGVIHGTFGQLILAGLLAVAAVTSRTWLGDTPPREAKGWKTERVLGFTLLALTTVQILLGAVLRHQWYLLGENVGGFLHGHITGAVVVFFLGLIVGFRAWGLYDGLAPLQKTGLFLMGIVVLQVGFGLAALIVAGANRGVTDPPDLDVLLTTLHQAAGACILAAAALAGTWSARLLREPES